MTRQLAAIALIWCAVDVSLQVYACFGFDYTACETFIRLYTDSLGVPLTCWIK